MPTPPAIRATATSNDCRPARWPTTSVNGFPTAASLHLEDSDQGSHFAALKITDAAGNTLHRIGDAEDANGQDADGDLDILASNFDNDSVSSLLTNYGTRRSPDYRLDLAGHGATDPQSQPITRSQAVAEFNASQASIAAPVGPQTRSPTEHCPRSP